MRVYYCVNSFYQDLMVFSGENGPHQGARILRILSSALSSPPGTPYSYLKVLFSVRIPTVAVEEHS